MKIYAIVDEEGNVVQHKSSRNTRLAIFRSIRTLKQNSKNYVWEDGTFRIAELRVNVLEGEEPLKYVDDGMNMIHEGIKQENKEKGIK